MVAPLGEAIIATPSPNAKATLLLFRFGGARRQRRRPLHVEFPRRRWQGITAMRMASIAHMIAIPPISTVALAYASEGTLARAGRRGGGEGGLVAR